MPKKLHQKLNGKEGFQKPCGLAPSRVRTFFGMPKNVHEKLVAQKSLPLHSTDCMAKELERIIDKSFRAACRVLFKEEIGPLADFEQYLLRYAYCISEAKSAISGKPVYFSAEYRPEAKFVSFDEQEKLRNAKIGANDIKDIDSLFRASEEIAYYCGNKAFGNSQQNSGFDNIFDSSFVYKSHEVMKGEHIALSNLIINSKYLFGCSSVGDSLFCVNTSEQSWLTRAFECGMTYFSSDLYYCYYLKHCQNCMFSFNLISKRDCIGNNQLTHEKYELMKTDLVRQIVDVLRQKKNAPVLPGLITRD